MRIALCNEVIREMDFAAQCEFAAKSGYDGLEVAPFTLDENPHLLPANRRAEIRRAATDSGISITGLHWLLISPEGLSLNSPDDALRARTVDVMERLVGLCADLGGSVLVHGSPKQRSVPEGEDPAPWLERTLDTLRAAARAAENAGVTYCIEPLSSKETNFVTTIAEAVQIVDEVGSPAFRTMIDNKAATPMEDMPVADLIDKWLPTGKVAHIHLNDSKLRAPGQGEDKFQPILAALKRQGYMGVVGVEPFIYEPDGPATAAYAIGYLRGILETLD
ncbi:MAG: sugar phosphate isomerase/epimerase [Rhodospirillales bacterium]|nr:sugar phosphate isomerase/epimerase [Rhodospirillales bacterium]